MSGFTHEPPTGGKADWYTPKYIFDALQTSFDLDPCHPQQRLPWIPVGHIISLPQDGLAADWKGRVWLNPPYGKETPDWLKKMAAHGNGIALVFSRTDTKWFHDAIANAHALLFLDKRIRFIDSDTMEQGGSPGCGSVLIAWGADCAEILRGADLGTYIKLGSHLPPWS